jgi:pyrroline-5-carboxylate reductase
MTTFDFTVGILGAGSMGGAIARGLVEAGVLAPQDIALCDTSPKLRASFAEAGHSVLADAAELAEAGDDVLVLAIKPQVLPQVVAPLADALAGRLVVSIAAGVSLRSLQELLPASRVVRVMPNLPLQLRSGATAIAAGERATADDVERVRMMFAMLGVACVMREDQLDVAGAVSGCGPAYFALLADQLTRAGVAAGLATVDARRLVLSTMRGVAEQLLESDEHPRAYMDKVTSPGGTTAAALRAMEPLTLEACFAAVGAALARTRELAGEAS